MLQQTTQPNSLLNLNCKPFCSCEGSGWLPVEGRGVRECNCRIEASIKRKLEQIPPEYEHLRLEEVEPDLKRHPKQALVWRTVRAYPDRCYLICGRSGAGKSAVMYCRSVSALLICAKCTRKGSRNSSNSGIGALGACGSRVFSFHLMLMSSGYNAIVDFDKVVLVGVPPTIASGMKKYSEVFCRDAGFDHISRYVSGLVLGENKTLQGICAQQVWPEGEEVTRRAIHATVFEAGWSSGKLMRPHNVVAVDHRGR